MSAPGRIVRLAARGIGGVLGIVLGWLLAVWPPPAWYRSHWPARTAFMAMRGDSAPRYRPVPLDSIARSARQAVTVGEDDAFWDHHGIDWKSLRHALGYRRDDFAWNSRRDRDALLPLLREAWTRRDAIRGASTITQQLAKNLYLSPSRNPLRKVKEAVTAYRLEQALGKERILELYLNVVELGDGIWGFEAASQAYFRRSAAGLSTGQGAALAATLPHPLTSNPAVRPGRMRWRQQLILRRMRGENIEVPRVEAEIPAPSLPPDILPLADTLMPQAQPPADTTPAEYLPDSPP